MWSDAEAADGGMAGDMLSGLAKVLLTSTALSPIALTYASVAYAAGFRLQAMTLLMLFLLLLSICLLLLRFARKRLERLNFKVETIEPADRENISLLLLYLLPLFTVRFSDLDWKMWGVPAGIFVFLNIVGSGHHFNPMLALLKWHFYKVGTNEGVSYVLITRKRLKNASEVITVGQLTDYIVLDLEGGAHGN
jgi:hypothetical protein